MPKILVIADDFTGAAEIGGMAYLFGLSVRIITESSRSAPGREDVLVMDTNTRRLDPTAASEKVLKMLEPFYPSDIDLIYKKVDSILRGPVESEIKAVMSFASLDRAVLIPANPSRGRIIKNGIYFIDDTPINRTDFINDPEYPRNSAKVARLITDASETQSMYVYEPSNIQNKIVIPDVYLPEHFRSIIDRSSEMRYLPAGGADFFKALLQYKLKLSVSRNYSCHHPGGRKHVIAGSHCEQSNQIITDLTKQGYASFLLPEAALGDEVVYTNWLARIKAGIQEGSEIIIARPENKICNTEGIRNITSLISKATLELLKYCTPEDELFIEGGETASHFFRNMGNTVFRVKEVIADGVIKLELDRHNIGITVKPGSYLWPEGILIPTKSN